MTCMHGRECPWGCPAMYTFDIDGTLVSKVEDHAYQSAEAVLAGSRPIPRACRRVAGLIDAGVPVAFVTRRDGSFLREATLQQLRAYVHAEIRDDQVHMIPQFEGFEHATTWTVRLLRQLRPVAHVGDHDDLDRAAASAAGVAFLHADAWARGDPLPLPRVPLT